MRRRKELPNKLDISLSIEEKFVGARSTRKGSNFWLGDLAAHWGAGFSNLSVTFFRAAIFARTQPGPQPAVLGSPFFGFSVAADVAFTWAG